MGIRKLPLPYLLQEFRKRFYHQIDILPTSLLTSPIINQPNVAILSTESVKKKAVVVESEGNEDSIEIRHSGILSLTWDHRVFDGSTALLFLNAIKDKLENHDWSGEIS